MQEQKTNTYFSIITISVFLFLILPWLISDGMFMDGLIYATVSKNLANGYGSFWNLHLTKLVSDTYNDQPPLTIWITSFFFKLLGNSLYTERIYSFLTAIINLVLIRAIWQRLFANNKEKIGLWWLPVLLWILPPACFWSFANNMEENTMSVFILMAIYFYLKFENSTENKAYIFLSSLFLFLAAMTKGVQGTFALVMPVLSLLIFKKITLPEAIKRTVFLASFLVIGSILLYLYEPSRVYFEQYYQKRLLSTFTNHGTATTNTRLYLLFRLCQEMILPLSVALLIKFISEKVNVISKISSSEKQRALWFLGLALAGTLPLMITSEQRRFYLVPTYPLYAITISLFIGNNASWFVKYISQKVKTSTFRVIVYLLPVSVIIFSAMQIGKVKRDKEMLHDLRAIGEIIPSRSIIYIPREFFTDWSLQLYLKRYYEIDLSLDLPSKKDYYFLELKSNEKPKVGEELPLDLQKYRLVKITP